VEVEGAGNVVCVTNGAPGGSGGGGGFRPVNASTVGGTGNTPPVSPPQGNNGGNANPSPLNPDRGGGGGGASAAGTSSCGNSAGPGGNGVATSITGSSVSYAGGGGGGKDSKILQMVDQVEMEEQVEVVMEQVMTLLLQDLLPLEQQTLVVAVVVQVEVVC
jgi:hypothetical protein